MTKILLVEDNELNRDKDPRLLFETARLEPFNKLRTDLAERSRASSQAALESAVTGK
jgi:hypothetical protein